MTLSKDISIGSGNTVIDGANSNGIIQTANGAFNNIYYRTLPFTMGPTNYGYAAGGWTPQHKQTQLTDGHSLYHHLCYGCRQLIYSQKRHDGGASHLRHMDMHSGGRRSVTIIWTRSISRWPFSISYHQCFKHR